MHQAIPGNCKYVPSLICGLCVRLSGTLGIEEDEQTRPCFCSHLFQSLQCVLLPSSPCPCTTYVYTRRQQFLEPICGGMEVVRKQFAVLATLGRACLFRVNVVRGPNDVQSLRSP